MNNENQIRKLIQHEKDKDKKFILFMLLKFNDLIDFVNNKNQKSPLLLLEQDSIIFIYKNKEIDNFEYIFTDPEEILQLLQKLLYEGKKIKFFYEIPEEEISKEKLMSLIEKAVKENDREKYLLYCEKYNN